MMNIWPVSEGIIHTIDAKAWPAAPLDLDLVCGHCHGAILLTYIYFIPHKKKVFYLPAPILSISVQFGIGATIGIGQEIQCLLYMGHFLHIMQFSFELETFWLTFAKIMGSQILSRRAVFGWGDLYI